MKEKCDSCGLKFQVEPGFFIGAMYISYAFIVGIIIATAVIVSTCFERAEVWVYMDVVITVHRI